MATPLQNLKVTILDEQGHPLARVAGTLIGDNDPQLKSSDATGQCNYQNLAPGTYRLLTALEGYNTKSTPIGISAGSDKTATLTMNVVNEDEPSRFSELFFRVLTGLQYLFLAVIVGLFSFLLYKGISSVSFDLHDNDTARGMITFLVAVVTVSIALILVIAAFMTGGKDVDKRLAFGKEILTILIGVLGTIMGFYYGQATKPAAGGAGQQQAAIQLATPQLSSVPKIGAEFTLNTGITGGEPPYTYVITFDPKDAVTTADTNQISNNGKIAHTFKVTDQKDLAGKKVAFEIAVSDKNQLKGKYDKGSFTVTQ